MNCIRSLVLLAQRLLHRPHMNSMSCPNQGDESKQLRSFFVFCRGQMDSPIDSLSSSFSAGVKLREQSINHGQLYVVRDDLKLLGEGTGIPKSQGRGWRFESRLWNLLSTWQKTCRVVNCLLCFGVGLSAFCLKKKATDNSTNAQNADNNFEEYWRCKLLSSYQPTPKDIVGKDCAWIAFLDTKTLQRYLQNETKLFFFFFQIMFEIMTKGIWVWVDTNWEHA